MALHDFLQHQFGNKYVVTLHCAQRPTHKPHPQRCYDVSTNVIHTATQLIKMVATNIATNDSLCFVVPVTGTVQGRVWYYQTNCGTAAWGVRGTAFVAH